eukprot:TRINITY_DN5589_c0_g1_i1.p3 TRINITY_DN5589_c0_g1~~TRINITY_DN5589_c0_g1_i1.p3  ORF type:complete len:126 (-),score=28.98 TRINITY_DN5589_c0_g1_i1:770-1147(-)
MFRGVIGFVKSVISRNAPSSSSIWVRTFATLAVVRPEAVARPHGSWEAPKLRNPMNVETVQSLQAVGNRYVSGVLGIDGAFVHLTGGPRHVGLGPLPKQPRERKVKPRQEFKRYSKRWRDAEDLD